MYSTFPSVFLWELNLAGNLEFLTAPVYITALNTMRLTHIKYGNYTDGKYTVF